MRIDPPCPSGCAWLLLCFLSSYTHCSSPFGTPGSMAVGLASGQHCILIVLSSRLPEPCALLQRNNKSVTGAE